MFYVYILQSINNHKLYIGFANDLRTRLKKHKQELVQSTKHMLPVELIYYEAYRSKKDALIREKRLKKYAKGYASLKGRLKYSFINQEPSLSVFN